MHSIQWYELPECPHTNANVQALFQEDMISGVLDQSDELCNYGQFQKTMDQYAQWKKKIQLMDICIKEKLNNMQKDAQIGSYRDRIKALQSELLRLGSESRSQRGLLSTGGVKSSNINANRRLTMRPVTPADSDQELNQFKRRPTMHAMRADDARLCEYSHTADHNQGEVKFSGGGGGGSVKQRQYDQLSEMAINRLKQQNAALLQSITQSNQDLKSVLKQAESAHKYCIEYTDKISHEEMAKSLTSIIQKVQLLTNSTQQLIMRSSFSRKSSDGQQRSFDHQQNSDDNQEPGAHLGQISSLLEQIRSQPKLKAVSKVQNSSNSSKMTRKSMSLKSIQQSLRTALRRQRHAVYDLQDEDEAIHTAGQVDDDSHQRERLQTFDDDY
ncbi:hypothetical protein MIR68_000712 [Amoeboaphelidium protococcarum]|nr:hypothetical protein MIR68_000712 [Amoeboaphelidium protococcarum]